MVNEKKYVAKDYQSSNLGWISNIRGDENDSRLRKLIPYFNNTIFYLFPFATTTIFSVILYPRVVFLIKKILKKSEK